MHLTPMAIMDVIINKQKPTVVVDPKTFYSEATQFKFSNYDSAYIATQRLIQQGHRDIAFYGSDSHSTSFRERHEGFLSCMLTNKNIANRYSIIFDNEQKNYADEELFINTITNNPITAVVCANDLIALNAIKTLQRIGKRVPEDISLIGFDNIRTGEFVSPKLSTFNIPRQEIGEEVAKYVANSIKSHQIQLSQIIVRCNYIERESNIDINSR